MVVYSLPWGHPMLSERACISSNRCVYVRNALGWSAGSGLQWRGARGPKSCVSRILKNKGCRRKCSVEGKRLSHENMCYYTSSGIRKWRPSFSPKFSERSTNRQIIRTQSFIEKISFLFKKIGWSSIQELSQVKKHKLRDDSKYEALDHNIDMIGKLLMRSVKWHFSFCCLIRQNKKLLRVFGLCNFWKL